MSSFTDWVNEFGLEGMTYASQKRLLETDPTVSNWLKEAVLDLERRDPMDAANDAELLSSLCKLRMKETEQ